MQPYERMIRQNRGRRHYDCTPVCTWNASCSWEKLGEIAETGVWWIAWLRKEKIRYGKERNPPYALESIEVAELNWANSLVDTLVITCNGLFFLAGKPKWQGRNVDKESAGFIGGIWTSRSSEERAFFGALLAFYLIRSSTHQVGGLKPHWCVLWEGFLRCTWYLVQVQDGSTSSPTVREYSDFQLL